MRYLSIFLSSLFCFKCLAITNQIVDFYSDQKNYAHQARILNECYGDLDNDKLPEKVIVLDSGMSGDSGLGSSRDLLIYKMRDDESWYLWHTSHGVILDDNTGGMSGNPFKSITISNGTIIVKHEGGSRDKWHYTHRYRYQNNDWYLIGATMYQGALCDRFTSFDYNLITGKAIYKRGVEWDSNCPLENKKLQKPLEKTVSLPANPLPKMDNFIPGTKVITLKSDINSDVYY